MEVKIKMYLMSVNTFTSPVNGIRYFKVEYMTEDGDLKATEQVGNLKDIEEVIYKTVKIEQP
jgi:hypothetical protein